VFVLALDTATEACVAAVCQVEGDTVRVRAARAPVDARRHGELLAPLIDELLHEVGLRPAELAGVVAGVGPGPFTSLRVGIVTAAALADALDVPVAGICSLDGIAAAQPADSSSGSASLVVATDARRREVYWARYRSGRRADGPDVARPGLLVEQLESDERVVGSGAALYAEIFGARADIAAPRFPDPVGLVRPALPVLRGSEPASPLAPLYLRRPDATPPGAPKAATPSAGRPDRQRESSAS
jgi:tRNA threonylcarbamoyl adenosine modification protein YeaZ